MNAGIFHFVAHRRHILDIDIDLVEHIRTPRSPNIAPPGSSLPALAEFTNGRSVLYSVSYWLHIILSHVVQYIKNGQRHFRSGFNRPKRVFSAQLLHHTETYLLCSALVVADRIITG